VDGESLLGLPGLSAFVYGLANQGGSPSAHVGDLQVLDNIDAPASWRIYEAWVQQFLAGDRLSILAGLYDVNSEFDAVGSADLFLNSSFGIEPAFGQSGVNGPSIFPVTSLAVRARALLGEGWRVQAVVADGVPGDPADPGGTKVRLGGGDGALVVAEVGYLRPSARDVGPGSGPSTVRRRRAGRTEEEAPHDLEVAAGVWRYTGHVPEPADAPPGSAAPSGGDGAYVIGEARLLPPDRAGAGELWAFGMLGVAQERASLASSSVVLGVSGTGIVPGRPTDRFGLGLAAARRSRRLTGEAPGLPSWELTGEASYRFRVTDAIAVQPDLQVVHHPAAAPSVPDAVVLGLRFEADL
jgi:porin